MLQLRNLLVGILLAASVSGAFAASYTWTVPAVWGIAGRTFVTPDARCVGVADKLYSIVQGVYDRYSPGVVKVVWYAGGCSGDLADTVGDAYTLPFVEYDVGNDVYTTGNYVATLVSIQEDDFLGDVGTISTQRVLVMIGCALMFGIGMVVGKA